MASPLARDFFNGLLVTGLQLPVDAAFLIES